MDYWTNFEKYKADITVKEFYRGQGALDKMAEEGIFHHYIEPDQEIALIKLHVKLIESENGRKILVGRDKLSLFTEKDVEYGHFIDPVTPGEAFETTFLYPGAEQEGYLVLKLKKSDMAPKLCYGQFSDGTGGVWFELK